jgi:S1-C subfamily serine protease
MNMLRSILAALVLVLIPFSLIFESTYTIFSMEYLGRDESQAQIQMMSQNYSNNSPDVYVENTSLTAHPTSLVGNILNSIFEKTQDSVVQITRTVPQTGIVVDPLQENRTALGSGFLFDDDKHIITNNHVVGDAKILDVTFTNGDRLRANVTAVDPYIDIAVLRIIDTQNNTIREADQLKPLPLGNSSALKVGDGVIAIGNPYGLAGTMTTGIVGQVGRLVEAPNVGFSVPDVIQTDAAINPGNSGGPLLNLEGEVVGVNFAALQQGLGFAIPMNLIQKVVPTLIETGNYTHPYLGFSGTTLTSDLAASLDNITQNLKGVFVNTLEEGGPADDAGLQGTTTDQYGRKHGGDVIIGVNGSGIREFEELVSYLETNTKPGDEIVLNVMRNGTEIRLQTLLGERPSPSELRAENCC